MQLPPPIQAHLTGTPPTHTSRAKLATHITFWPQAEVEAVLTQAGYLSPEGKIAKKALEEGLVDTCEGKPLWNLKKTKKVLLALTRKPSKAASPAPIIPPKAPVRAAGPVWTDLENIGTYFGVGKNKIGTWLDQLGLRDYKPMQVNESGDIDMLDMANASKEKFQVKVPTQLALERGLAQVETVEYRGKGGKEKSFEKYSWDRDAVKALLVKAGHPLDTERKLLHRGKGKNSDVRVESLDDRARALHAEWKKLHSNPTTRKASWDLFHKKPKPLIMRVEMLMGQPRYIQDKLYLKEQ